MLPIKHLCSCNYLGHEHRHSHDTLVESPNWLMVHIDQYFTLNFHPSPSIFNNTTGSSADSPEGSTWKWALMEQLAALYLAESPTSIRGAAPPQPCRTSAWFQQTRFPGRRCISPVPETNPRCPLQPHTQPGRRFRKCGRRLEKTVRFSWAGGRVTIDPWQFMCE